MEDANELLKRVIDKIDSAAKARDATNGTKTRDICQQAFAAKLLSIIRCPACKNESKSIT